MTALIAIFLFSDFFYGGQDIGLYLFGAVLCGNKFLSKIAHTGVNRLLDIHCYSYHNRHVGIN